MSRLIFDLETNGLLDTMDRIHSLVIQDVDTGEMWSCASKDAELPNGDQWHKPIEEGIKMLVEADEIIGHNIIKFDLKAIKMVCPWFQPKGRIRDTLLLSRLCWPELRDLDFTKGPKRYPDMPKNQYGRYGLEAWGHRLGLHKGDYSKEMKAKGLDPWAEWNPEMQSYCEQDVRVTRKLLSAIEKKGYGEKAIELEHDFALVIDRMEDHGFHFDTQGAAKLYAELSQRRDDITRELQEVFPPWWVGHTVTVKKTVNRKLGDFPDVIQARYSDKTGKRLKDYVGPPLETMIEGAQYTKLTWETFNPGSRQHIEKRLRHARGWQPQEFTNDGHAKIDETVLKKLPWPEATLLKDFFLINKRIGQLAEGKEAWLKKERAGRIYGRVDTVGAVTRRCTHKSPNVAQVPSVKVDKATGLPLIGEAGEWGWECRSLFVAPEGYKLVGADASGLELRCLAHYMARYDGGTYAKLLLEDDIHTVNQKAAGLEQRSQAKTFIYAFLYGAGDEKIGSIVAPTASPEQQKKIGAGLKRRFLEQTPALKRLKQDVAARVKAKGYLKAIDGGTLFVRYPHAALNTLLQSCGSLIVKKATILAYHDLSTRGYKLYDLYDQPTDYDVALVAHVHDELQQLAKESHADEVGHAVVQAIRDTGPVFNFRCPLDGEYKVGSSWAATH